MTSIIHESDLMMLGSISMPARHGEDNAKGRSQCVHDLGKNHLNDIITIIHFGDLKFINFLNYIMKFSSKMNIILISIKLV